MNKIILSTLLFYVFTMSFSQTQVEDITASYSTSTEDLNRYTIGTQSYSFAVGSENNLNIESFRVNGEEFAIKKTPDQVVINRVDNAGTSGVRNIVFFENTGSNYNLKPEFVGTMESMLLSNAVNRGADNIFVNDNVQNTNNIERIDFLFLDGLTIPNDPTNEGFLVLDRGGNDNFKIALITGINSSNQPVNFSSPISVSAEDFGATSTSLRTSVLNDNIGGQLELSASVNSQSVGGVLLSYNDFGLSGGDQIFGYVLMANDVTATTDSEIVDITNNTFYPRNTNSNNGGIDLIAGGSVFVKAYIHNSTGWVDDPNSAVLTCDDYIFVTGGNASINIDITTGYLYFDNDANLDLNNNTLNICNDVVVRKGSSTALNSNFIFNGINPQNLLGGELTLDNLELNNSLGLQISGDFNLTDILTITNGEANIDPESNFRLVCDFSTPPQTAQVAEVTGSIVGEVSVEQCYPAKRAFRLVSSSVTTSTSIRKNWQEDAKAYNIKLNTADEVIPPGYGTHITGVQPDSNNASAGQDREDGLDYNPSGNPSMFTYDNNNRQWNPELVTDPKTLITGVPYRLMIRGDRYINITNNETPPSDTRLRAKGVLQIGSYFNSDLSQVAGDLSLIANPYHAQVDMNDVLTSSDTKNLSPLQYYIWDPTLGGKNGRGVYVAIGLPSGDASIYNPEADPTLPTEPTSANQYLQPMQAAFVMTKDNLQPTVINFKESFKDVTPDQTTTKSVSDPEYINIQLFDAQSYAEGNTPSDGLRINFNDAYSSSVKDDSPKLGNLDENLLRIEGSKGIAIERRPMPEGDEKLDLFVNQYRSEAYVMKFNTTDNLNTKVYIEDKYLDELTEITKTNNTYSFTVDGSISESTATDRFSLVLNPVSLSTPDEKLLSLSLYPNPTSDKFSISGQDLTQDAEVQIYNMLGQQVYKRNVNSQSTVEIRDFNVDAGLYLVKVKTSQGERTFKLIKE